MLYRNGLDLRMGTTVMINLDIDKAAFAAYISLNGTMHRVNYAQDNPAIDQPHIEVEDVDTEEKFIAHVTDEFKTIEYFKLVKLETEETELFTRTKQLVNEVAPDLCRTYNVDFQNFNELAILVNSK